MDKKIFRIGGDEKKMLGLIRPGNKTWKEGFSARII